ncbi:MAG: hypothetical protein AB1489_15300 [Acidobacteriota bacterium]
MQTRVVKTSDVETSTLSVPISLIEDDCTLRKYLFLFAQSCECDHRLCFWINLTGGRLRAYFRTNSGIESRTYSPLEVADAIFNKNTLFFQLPEEILSLLEESPQPQCKDLPKTSFELAYA